MLSASCQASLPMGRVSQSSEMVLNLYITLEFGSCKACALAYLGPELCLNYSANQECATLYLEHS